ncbi:MAG TPA: hypothetical protein VFZ18_08815 [Longimicrobiaceae bacterium]
MALVTLTEREQRWRTRAHKAVEAEETWEKCPDCLNHHPAGYDGPCDDPQNWLPRKPAEISAADRAAP